MNIQNTGDSVAREQQNISPQKPMYKSHNRAVSYDLGYTGNAPHVIKVCKTCWGNGKVVGQSKIDDKHCWDGSHEWFRNTRYLKIPEYKVIRRPNRGRRDITICEKAKYNKACSEICYKAHSNAELQVWKWLFKNDGT